MSMRGPVSGSGGPEYGRVSCRDSWPSTRYPTLHQFRSSVYVDDQPLAQVREETNNLARERATQAGRSRTGRPMQRTICMSR